MTRDMTDDTTRSDLTGRDTTRQNADRTKENRTEQNRTELAARDAFACGGWPLHELPKVGVLAVICLGEGGAP
jgi:hypothetical protein